MNHLILLCALMSLLVVAGCAIESNDSRVKYPKTSKVKQNDNYFGTIVEDPYRWLEDDNSAQTKTWVQEQNAVTDAYLDKIPYRSKLHQRLTELFNYARYSAPFHRGDLYFFYKNDGLQNQSVLYMQQGLDGEPVVLLDPNTFSNDGTTRMTAFSPDKAGKFAAYGISTGGSDWVEMHLIDLHSKTTLDDTLKWVKVSGIAWQNDGFYYSRYDAPASGEMLRGSNENHKVYFHKVNTPQEQDVLIYADPAHPLRFHTMSTTEDERFALLDISDRGSGKKGNAIYYRDNQSGDTAFKPIIAEVSDDEFSVITSVDDKLLVQTNRKAPNDRIVLIDPKHPEETNWREIVAEQPEPLRSAETAGGKLFTSYLKDVNSQVIERDLTGKVLRTVELPALGSTGGFGGLKEDTEVFYTFTSFVFPPAIYRYNLATGHSTLFREAEIPHFDPQAYETRQVFATSKDGTRVPMFMVYKKGLNLNGQNPTLLYGYGGFNISLTPGFSSLRLSLLEQGFVFAQANLRGGGEYGEQWHDAGTKLHKQNVFDDFIACARWLIDNKVTSSSKLAIQGGSNGGLLVGAVVNQRPDLFKAAVASVGVMDMLRYQKFTIGWNWKPDYGASDDNEAQFKYLYAYSPLHNIKSDVHYPAMLITTADHDDRVVPAHSFKYAATIQEKATGGPFLIRIDTNSGHGASSVTKSLEETTDVQSFLFQQLGVMPKN